MRARDVGLFRDSGHPGSNNAITDVPGVGVGHTTLISGTGRLIVGSGPVRTGVSIITPHPRSLYDEPIFAGIHRLNGNGELTGSHLIEDSGLLTSPIAITNTHSVGVVRDTLVQIEAKRQRGRLWWGLPIVGETWDGVLNDIDGAHVKPDHVEAAIAAISNGPVPEGNVGGGTGMICHGFKGGIGTSSRILGADFGGFVVGVLVQANHGSRQRLRIGGRPVGGILSTSDYPVPNPNSRHGAGSIITIVATNAPLIPSQCRSLAQRTVLGIGEIGGIGEPWSGDISLAFSTANKGMSADPFAAGSASTHAIATVSQTVLAELYAAVAEATAEAIVNALIAAETMEGRDGIIAYQIPHDKLRKIFAEKDGSHQ